MCGLVSLSTVREYFRKQGYEERGWSKDRRRVVFHKPGDRSAVAFSVPVIDEKSVCERISDRIRMYFI